MNKLIKILFVLIFFLVGGKIFATHIRAADITAVRIGPTKYRIILSVYTDYKNVTDNPNAGSSAIDVRSLEVGLGDQQNPLKVITVNRSTVTEIVPGETFENLYVFEYDFPSAYNGYKIYFVGQNRNANVININNSVGSFIYVETYVFIDGFSPINSSPEFTVPPIDQATTNQIYTHNPGAFDLDGDSLSFELIDPRDKVDKTVDGYRYPDNPSFGTPSKFTIDSKTGQITWDTPKTPGEYNIAFRVNEYRDGLLIGYVVRDMQINVYPSNNLPPILVMPRDTCIGVGQNYRAVASAYDPNKNTIEMELYGGFSELGGKFASIFQVSPDAIIANLSWTPDCNAVGSRPIQGIIRVSDNHPVSLSTVNTWEILVIGSPIKNVSALANQNQINLFWSPYECKNSRGKIEIYRRECDTSLIKRDPCTAGVPSDWGFIKIGEVNSNEVSFTDNGDVAGLTSGITYFYLLVVDFGTPSYGISYASDAVSASLSNQSPLFTQVSFDKKNEDKFVNISWNHFTFLDTNVYQRPFTYQVINGSNILFSESNMQILNKSISIESSKIDNSKALYLNFLDVNGNLIASKSTAYTELLIANGSDESLLLSWTNKNLWFYSENLKQEVFVFVKGEDTLLVDSVNGGTTKITIPNLVNGDTVCSFVKMSYTYCLDGLDTIFNSFTNTSCDLVRDNIAPCAPILSLEKINCDFQQNSNALSWTNPICKDDIATYKLFKQELVAKDKYYFVQELDRFTLQYKDLDGKELNCYYIQAIDSSGNISANSNVVCQDFCGTVIFPNVFTPNGDGKNDFLLSESSFEGFDELIFLVFNRWGKEVYKAVDFTEIKWDGKSDNGNEVSTGIYFIYFSGKKLTGSKEKVEYKGWLQIAR